MKKAARVEAIKTWQAGEFWRGRILGTQEHYGNLGETVEGSSIKRGIQRSLLRRAAIYRGYLVFAFG